MAKQPYRRTHAMAVEAKRPTESSIEIQAFRPRLPCSQPPDGRSFGIIRGDFPGADWAESQTIANLLKHLPHENECEAWLAPTPMPSNQFEEANASGKIGTIHRHCVIGEGSR